MLPTATITPGPSPTSTPLNTPTATIGPTPTSTVAGPCGIWFEGPVFAGDQFVPVTGELSSPAPTIVELYAILGPNNDLIAQAELEDVGPGHACPGHAVFYIDPSQFVLVANMMLIAVNTGGWNKCFHVCHYRYHQLLNRHPHLSHIRPSPDAGEGLGMRALTQDGFAGQFAAAARQLQQIIIPLYQANALRPAHHFFGKGWLPVHVL